MYIRSIFSGIILYLLCLFLSAQINEPINIKTELVYLSDTEAKIVFTLLSIRGGMYILPTGGRWFYFGYLQCREGSRGYSCRKIAAERNDNLFGMNVRYFESTA